MGKLQHLRTGAQHLTAHIPYTPVRQRKIGTSSRWPQHLTGRARLATSCDVPTMQASDLHMELCGFDVYNNENVRAHRRNVGAYFELSVEGSPRGERLQAALERAASRLEKAVAQHEGLQKLGVTFRTDNNDPHITVHK